MELACVDFLYFAYRQGALLAYNVVLDEWSQVGGKGFPVTHRTDKFGHPIQAQGPGVCSSSSVSYRRICHDIPKGFAVWELQPYTDRVSVEWVEVGQLLALCKFNLHLNNISGAIPSSLNSLSSLRGLNRNRFSSTHS
ncbi:hypothetical protein GOP47_0004709 [Adiantum capillus-veneris]|uniref:Uncharacterized protein n=1 Tax=Adiantum capillus-veneris TaxID=13818 RepID=A0A9D4V7Y0_ADICA|nr:hypothetical protein GOP47_0004709 [Adiantum capillus-veneris]